MVLLRFSTGICTLLVLLAELPPAAGEGAPCPVVGKASFYGDGFEGKKTASGDRFDSDEMTAAHRTLPLGSTATVTNLDTGKQVDVEINDRGPMCVAVQSTCQRVQLKRSISTKIKVSRRSRSSPRMTKGKRRTPRIAGIMAEMRP